MATLPPPELPYEPGTPEYGSWAAEDKGGTSLALCWTFTGLATLFTVARLYTRLSLFRNLKMDDYWCAGGLVCALLSTILTTIAVDYGNGKHYQILSIDQQSEVRKYTLAAFIPSMFSFCLPKFAVVSLLTRLLNPARWHRWFLWAMNIALFVSLIACIGLLFGQCKPTAGLWDVTLMPTMKCLDRMIYVHFSIYTGAFSAFIDFYMAVYPAIVLYKLQMKMRKKLALMAALSIGCVGGALAIYKTIRIPQGLGNPDFSYETADLINWTIIEGCTITIAATIPVLSPLMDKIFKKYNPFASTRKSSRKSEPPAGKPWSSHPGSHGRVEMDERHLRRPLDPLDPDMELAETIVGNDSAQDVSSIKKASDDLEAQRGGLEARGSQSSGNTEVFENVDLDADLRRSDTVRSSGSRVSRSQDLERLDREIPWETRTASPTSPRRTEQWPLRV